MRLKTMEEIYNGKDKKHVSFQGELRKALQKIKLLICHTRRPLRLCSTRRSIMRPGLEYKHCFSNERLMAPTFCLVPSLCIRDPLGIVLVG